MNLNMLRKFAKIGCILFLFLYTLRALTPGTMYVVVDADPTQPMAKHTIRDIVWTNVLYSFLSDDDDDSDSVLTATVAAQTTINENAGSDLVLVRKKRALLRQKFDVTPSFDIQYLSYFNFAPAPALFTAHESLRPLLRETDGYLVLNTGLSPPSFVS